MPSQMNAISLQAGLAAAALALLSTGACCDLAARIIPDRVSLGLAAIGLAGRALSGPGAVAASVALATMLFLALAVMHARGGIGGGDVKLMSAVALGLSPAAACHFLLVTACAGGVLAVVHLVARRLPRPACCPAAASRLRRLWTVERWRWRREGCIPYGVAISCGGAWVILPGLGT
jgi:prepilin peptidase CpaA